MLLYLVLNGARANIRHLFSFENWVICLSPERDMCTWVSQTCLSHLNTGWKHTAHVHAYTHTHCWEIPSKNSTPAVLCEYIPVLFITSHSWNESWIYSFEDPTYTPELAINLLRLKILLVIIFLLDFLDGSLLWECKRAWNNRQAEDANKTFRREEIP